MVRTFIAVELSEPIRAAALGAVQALQRAAPGPSKGVGWLREESMHVTLKFIGYAAEDAIPDVKAALRKAATSVPAFDAEFAGAGGFPSIGRPRVLWVGLRRGAAELQSLRDAVEGEVAPLGFPTEARAFHGHVTLGRVKDPRSAKPMGEAMRGLGDVALGSMRVQSVTLFRSELKPTGAVYTALGRFPLCGAPSPPG